MGVLLIVAMVRRAVQPGCKFDIMTILEGPQGCGKSSLAAALAGGSENFTDVPLLGRDTKVVAEALVGKWVAEVSELVGLKRSEVEDVKALISRTDDRARPAYGRFVESYPRTCVLIGTTNSAEYLADDTGNRRFVPVRVGQVDLTAFIRDRDQLFAEAVVREKGYGPLTLPRSVWRDAAAEAETRRVTDPWIERLREGLKQSPGQSLPGGCKRITNTAVEARPLPEPHNCNPGTFRRITRAMRDLGWQSGALARRPERRFGAYQAMTTISAVLKYRVKRSRMRPRSVAFWPGWADQPPGRPVTFLDWRAAAESTISHWRPGWSRWPSSGPDVFDRIWAGKNHYSVVG